LEQEEMKLSLILPLHQCGSPFKPTTESSKNDQVAFIYFMFEIPKTKWNCCGCCISWNEKI